MTINVNLDDEKLFVLQTVSVRTGRTIEELIENFLEWYIALLKQELGVVEQLNSE